MFFQATTPEPQETIYLHLFFTKAQPGVQNKHPAIGASCHGVALSDIMKGSFPQTSKQRMKFAHSKSITKVGENDSCYSCYCCRY